MNKLLLGLAVGVCCLLAAGQPTIEIFEFGKNAPSVSKTLAGKRAKLAGADWKCEVRKNDGPVTGWSLRFASPRHEPIRLAFRFTSPLDFAPVRFWDGNRERKVAKLPMVRNDILEAFPMATAENGEKGRALGFTPQTILSQFRRALTTDGLVLEARIVVDDRRVQDIDIVEFDFLPEFGWRNAVEDYQNAFMSWFVPTSGVDPRIYGVSGYLGGGHLARPFELHSARKTKIQWEWTYAPWYESGNWYAPGVGWKGEKHEYRNYFRHGKGKMLPRKEYDDALTREMFWGDKAAAIFFYILVKDVHKHVAGQYSDATQGISGLPSLPSNRGKTLSTFAPGSPLFDYLKNQLKQVADHYEVSGFAFDMANSSDHFTTPSQLEYAVGRSWKDDGTIYTSDTVAPIPFSDYIHTLKRGDKRMGTMFNAAVSDFSPFPFFHCDGAIMEGAPFANVNMLVPLRMIMGRKPVTFWDYKKGLGSLIQMWRVAEEPEKKAQIDLAIKQMYLMKCYELGFNLMNRVSGDPFFAPHLSALHAISKAGAHPVSAVRGAEPFWVSRFGDNAGTILTFGNPKREKITCTVRVVNRYLGKGNKYAFFPARGKLKQKFVDGETVFELTVEPKEVVVLRTVAVSGGISGLTASVDGRNIAFQADGPFEFTLPAEDFDGRRIAGAGKKEFFSGKAANDVTLAVLPAYRIFGDPGAMTGLMAPRVFPAVEAGKGRDARIAAEMLAYYRPYMEKKTALFKKPVQPDLVVTEPGKGKAGKKICLGTPEDFPGFKSPTNWQGAFLAMPDADTLWIGGSTPAEVRRATMVYFDMLDQLVRVNFSRPSGWGGRAKPEDYDGQKYLQLTGDPKQKNNAFHYAFWHMPQFKGGDRITFKVSCKLEKLTAGKFQVGVYEFSDPRGKKSIRFQSVDIPVSSDWLTISRTITLHPKTQSAKFYFVGRNAGKGDTLLVRSLDFEKHLK